jgi:Tfp pilus tip-associated adhesin PilY1
MDPCKHSQHLEYRWLFLLPRSGLQRQQRLTLQDARDYNLCRQYPNGNYKPTGVIQKYSDQLRLAAFGYLMDQTASYNNGRYGGVLRAPMKYVGNKTYDVQGQDNTPREATQKPNGMQILEYSQPTQKMTRSISAALSII